MEKKLKIKFTWTIPNVLTTIRLLAVPFLAYFIYASGQSDISSQQNKIALGLFLAIWTTDVVDGFIARHFNQVSEFGKLYDPFVDKVFQFTTALMMLVIGKIPVWVFGFILTKELIMIIGGAYFLRKHSVVIAAKWYGKAATVLFVLSLASLFIIPVQLFWIKDFLFLPPVVMATYALINYGKQILKSIEAEKKQT